MGDPLIANFLAGQSREIRDLASNEAVLVGFLTLLKEVDDLPGVRHRFYESPRSLYQVTATDQSIAELVEILRSFFGDPAKSPGEALPVGYRFEPVVKCLKGVRKEQALFLKKLKTGSFYGALWPWQTDEGQIEILLGYHATGISASDYAELESLANRFLSQKKIESVSSVGGQIHGISLPSFLQMSEMEGATYTLKVTSGKRVGYLYLNDGSLTGARMDAYSGDEAAYRIISWDHAAIQIEPAEPDRPREIHDPLMQVMMESLKIKDESGGDPSSASLEPSSDSQAPPTIDGAPATADPPSIETPRPADVPSPAAPPVMNGLPKERSGSPPKPARQPSTPFEKPADRSIGRQDRLSKKQRLMVVLAVAVVLAIGVAGMGHLLKTWKTSKQYEQLQTNLTATDSLDTRIVLLMRYMKAHPEDAHRAALERQLADYYSQREKNDFEQTVSKVNQLPVNDQFEKKALSLYTAFLTKYPDSSYVEEIQSAIQGIEQLIGTAYFESLKKVSANDFLTRYQAYRSYLEEFPQSEERQAVMQMIVDLAIETAKTLETQIAQCDAKQHWDPCLARCDKFLSTFTAPAETVTHTRSLCSGIQDEKELLDLTAEAAATDGDRAKARQVYVRYLKERPDTSKKKEILKRIDALTADLARQQAWLATENYATNPANDIFSRVQRLDAYLADRAAAPFEAPAKKLRKKLEPELTAAIRSRQDEKQRRNESARQKRLAEDRRRERQRIQRTRDRMAEKLRPLEARYAVNPDGTVTDRTTGLTWCLLDSYLVLNKLISYERAQTYVRRLDTAGYTDWRLPTAGELATIYKNSPFFPDSGAPWYWSSESFARGFHRVVDVVTSRPETAFKRISKREDRAGAVRAVRR